MDSLPSWAHNSPGALAMIGAVLMFRKRLPQAHHLTPLPDSLTLSGHDLPPERCLLIVSAPSPGSLRAFYMSNEGALANLDDDAAIAEIASGTLMHQIAARYGVSKVAIRKRLKRRPDYLDAVHSQAECLVDQATAELMEVPPDAVLIARARARVDGAHKWAAARDPATWGAKTQVTDLSVHVHVHRGLTLEGEILKKSVTLQNPGVE